MLVEVLGLELSNKNSLNSQLDAVYNGIVTLN